MSRLREQLGFVDGTLALGFEKRRRRLRYAENGRIGIFPRSTRRTARAVLRSLST